MPQEIEKKYLISEDGRNYATDALFGLYSSILALKNDVLKNGKPIKQGYLSLNHGSELSDKLNMDVDFNPSEARLRDKAGELYFTLKGSGGLSRNELELEISQVIFDEFWSKTKGKRVEKYRLDVAYKGHTLEIDVYTDRNLIVAEIEVPSVEQANKLSVLGKDVTSDKTYKNKNLAK